ncbi:MAG: cbb3-type cytochrome c oxidase N-terminal domain-containing protein [Bdellovibrionales bacterium]
MSNENDQIIENHEYDGIQEFDNPLPMWWMTTFFITVIFGFLYWIHYEFGGGPSLKQYLDTDMQEIQARQQKAAPPEDNESDLQALLADASVADKGHGVFQAKCAVCHGQELQGGIGPNLTDDYWINGKGTIVDILKVMRTGVLDKGMPSWQGQVPEADLKAVAVFVAKSNGSNPPNPKPPQGEKVGGR